MQANAKIVRILVVALIVSLVLGACGGGTSGSVWFNFPSARLVVREDGSANAYGINLPPILAPAQIQQLQSVNIQRLEVRIGYNGVHVYANGADLPYLSWDATSVETVQGLLPQLPGVPNAQLIANLLPWLRTIGLGVRLDIPVGPGWTEQSIDRWRGETTITPYTPEELVVGPVVLGGIAFDEQGNLSVQGVEGDALMNALGMEPVVLPPDTLALVQALDIDMAVVKVHSNGIDLSIDDAPLPGVAYDPERLETLAQVLPAFVTDPAQLEMINQVLAVLPATDATIAVSFTGEPAMETSIMPVEVNIDAEGRLQVQSIPVGAEPMVPAETVANLQAAGVEQLDVALDETGLFLAANGQPLPSITWTEDSLGVMTSVAGAFAGIGAEGINGMLDIATGLGPQATVRIAPAEGTEAVEATMQPGTVEADAQGPAIRLTLGVDSQGNITSVGDLGLDVLSLLGVSLPSLPPDVVANLQATGASQVEVDTDPGVLHLKLDGQEAITVNYDTASLQLALQLAAPFLGDTPLGQPGVNQLVTEQIVPLVPVSDVNIVLNLE
jgi:hypothetical protein